MSSQLQSSAEIERPHCCCALPEHCTIVTALPSWAMPTARTPGMAAPATQLLTTVDEGLLLWDGKEGDVKSLCLPRAESGVTCFSHVRGWGSWR